MSFTSILHFVLSRHKVKVKFFMLFENILNDDLLVKPRVKDLIRDKMAFWEEDRIKITPKGKRLVWALQFHRKIIGVTEIGG